jgi:hypothetical protein
MTTPQKLLLIVALIVVAARIGARTMWIPETFPSRIAAKATAARWIGASFLMKRKAKSSRASFLREKLPPKSLPQLKMNNFLLPVWVSQPFSFAANSIPSNPPIEFWREG